ncbi:hypothetical protein ACN469_41320 [Corallococcus terminator]
MPKPRPSDVDSLSTRADKPAVRTQAAPDVYSTAQVFADVHVTREGTVVVLAGTPHPDSDHGHVAGEDLWDFDQDIKWSQPWNDIVWVKQIDVDKDELEANGLDYDVDFNRLLPKDGIHSLAFFKNRLFVSVGDQVLRMEKERGVALMLPSPSHGVARLVVAGGQLWTVFPHQLASSRDGKRFEPIAFR